MEPNLALPLAINFNSEHMIAQLWELSPVFALMGLVIIGLVLVIRTLYAELKSERTRFASELVAKESVIAELNEKRMQEAILNLEVLRGLRDKMERCNPVPLLEKCLPMITNGIRAIGHRHGLQPHELGMD
jgi:membrane protein insertase Oxa1/YidC/SpoIIIJ